MLKALHDDSTGETELSGTRVELLSLAMELRDGVEGEAEALLTRVSDPSPYSRSLRRIESRQPMGKVRVSLSGDGEALEIEGGTDSLSLLAENLQAFALEADQGDHLHVDFYPGHDYLAEGSGSLVVVLDGRGGL